jgi:hypothetical protein
MLVSRTAGTRNDGGDLMRTALAIGTALVFCFAAPAAAADDGIRLGAVSSPLMGVGDAHGTGAGRANFGLVHFELSAHERPTGDFGQVSLRASLPAGEVSYKVQVTCVNLHPFPSTAGAGLIQGVVTQVSPVPNFAMIAVGDRHLTLISDGGEPSSTAPVDSFFDVPDPQPSLSCKGNPFTATVPNVEQGNVNIKLGERS